MYSTLSRLDILTRHQIFCVTFCDAALQCDLRGVVTQEYVTYFRLNKPGSSSTPKMFTFSLTLVRQ